MPNSLFQDDTNDEEYDYSFREFTIESIQKGIKILDSDQNWNRLLYKESIAIERKDPSLNRGLKASRTLKLFK